MKRSFALASLVCNSLIILFTLFSVGGALLALPTNTGASGAECLRFFTIDSNILLAIAAAALIPSLVSALKAEGRLIPTKLLQFKHIATSAIVITFLVSVFWLFPTQGFDNTLAGTKFLVHVINPLLAVVSFCIFERGIPFSTKGAALGILPLLAYGVVYIVMVCVIGEANGGWPDLYGFADMMVVVVIALILLQALVSLALWVPHKLLNWKNRADRSV